MSPRGGIEICGVGAVTGYGWGRRALWEGLRSAKPAATLTRGYGFDHFDDADVESGKSDNSSDNSTVSERTAVGSLGCRTEAIPRTVEDDSPVPCERRPERPLRMRCGAAGAAGVAWVCSMPSCSASSTSGRTSKSQNAAISKPGITWR